MKNVRSYFAILALAFLMPALAVAKGPSAISLSAEALSAKALLEELIVQRYSNELGTIIPRDLFSIGAQLELTQVAPNTSAPVVKEEPITDLMLGTLDPNDLLKKFSNGDSREVAKTVLSSYRIKTVQVSVGLKEEKDTARKAQVEKWLADRIQSEFGKNGKGLVNIVTYPEVKPEPKSFWDLLTQLQNLAGQIVLALALLLGTVLWRFLSPSQKSASMDPMTVNMNSQGAGAGARGDEKSLAISLEKQLKENEGLAKDIDAISTRLLGLMAKVGSGFDAVARSWCQQGESGQFKLVCFAEAVGREIGRLPIPVDALANVTKIFARMSETGLKEKKAALEKAYWDLLSVINLGADALNQPFSYLGGVNVDTVNTVLMDQNPKMRTLVSLYLPQDLREKYMRSLDSEKKREILESAAGLSDIPAAELKSMDSSLSSILKNSGGSEDSVPLEMSVHKIVASLTRTEEIELLRGMTGYAVQAYKRMTASLAFLDEWPDDVLSMVVSRVPVDELVAFLRLRQDMKDRLLALAPPMSATMAGDELKMEDKLSESDRDALLTNFTERLENMVAAKEVALESIFPSPVKPVPLSAVKPAA